MGPRVAQRAHVRHSSCFALSSCYSVQFHGASGEGECHRLLCSLQSVMIVMLAMLIMTMLFCAIAWAWMRPNCTASAEPRH
eukprot:9472574-Pyramimonas_sp.AAC.1